MKRQILQMAVILLTIIFTGSTTEMMGQKIRGNKKVDKEERIVEAFHGIEISGSFDVYLTQSKSTSLIIETDENLLDRVKTKVRDSILKISISNIKNATELNVYISNPDFRYLKVSGAVEVYSQNTLKADHLELIASGASQAEIRLEVDDLFTEASGAASVRLAGYAENHTVEASGAADVKAGGLQTLNTDAKAGGASNIRVNASKKVTSESSGAGDVHVTGKPETFISDDKDRDFDFDFEEDMEIRSWESGDTTIVKIGGVTVQVIEDDSTTVSIGNSDLVVDEDGNVKFRREKKQKFDGHWAGFGLGINGYLNKDREIGVPKDYDFLDLTYEKSIDVNFNIFEQNINLINNKFGMVTGLGLRWNNYRFKDNVKLIPDSSEIAGVIDNTQNWQKSKLVVNYLNVPLLFEYQTNRFSKSNSFHIAAGMILGWRYATHTKRMYKESGRQKIKNRDSFHLKPFRYDATVRVGWGIINLYATYSLNSIFKENRGPELYPFAVGLTLVGW